MNLKLLKLTAFLLIWAVTFTSCVDPIEPETVYPINVPYTEYSLLETTCQWINLFYDDKVIVINSNEDLEKYCEGNCPAIDFSKNSLLLASGITDMGVAKITITNLKQHAPAKYNLTIETTLNDTIITKQWSKALITEKLGEESKVRLTATLKETEIFYPRDVPFEAYSLGESVCGWKEPDGPVYNTFFYKVSMINDNENLGTYIRCFNVSNYPEIDFSKYTLLLAQGWGQNIPNYKNLQQLSIQRYAMSVNLSQELSPPTPINIGWHVPIIVSKIPDGTFIGLTVTKDP